MLWPCMTDHEACSCASCTCPAAWAPFAFLAHHLILQPQIIAPSGRALWRYTAPAGGNATVVNVQACVRTNVLQEATLAIYEDDRLAWCAMICLWFLSPSR